MHQAFDIASGQQIQGLLTNTQSHFQHLGAVAQDGGLVVVIGRVHRVVVLVQLGAATGQQGGHLQAQAFAQVARAHAHRLQAVQEPKRHGEVVHQVFHLLIVITGQTLGQAF